MTSIIRLKYLAVLRMNWIQALEYRANALVGLIAILSGLFIEYQIWGLIFETQGISSVKGFTFSGLMVFIFLSIIVGQLKSSWHTSGEMIEGIRTGDINKYLIRPVSYFWYHFMMFIGYNSLYYIVYAAMITGLVLFMPSGTLFPSVFHMLGFLLSLCVSVYLSYCIYYTMICFAFWFGEVRSLVVAYNLAMIILSGQYIPIRLFPDNVLRIIDWTPFRYLVDFPVSIATGLIPPSEWPSAFGYAIAWCVVISLVSSMVYRLGIRSYEAYGS